MKAIRSDVSFFTKASQSPGFWKERGLAEETARGAERSRAMLEGLDGLAAQCESLEDLAFESWYERRDENAATLIEEVKGLRAALRPRKLELFATMFPMVEGVVLYFTAGRSAWHRVPELALMYSRWAEAQKLEVKAYTCFFTPEESRPEGEDKNDPAVIWKWKEGYPPTTHQPLPEGAALAVSGGPAMFALWSEHGAHRFLDGSGTSVVRVRFEAREVRSGRSLLLPNKLNPLMPGDELRKVSISKDAVKDLRMQRDYPWKGGHIDLGALLDDAVEFKVFGPDADPYR